MALPRLSLAALVFARGCDDLRVEARQRLGWELYRRHWRRLTTFSISLLALALEQIGHVEGEREEQLVELVTARGR